MTIATLDLEVIEYPTNPQNAEAIKAQNDLIVAAANLGTIAAGALTADAAGRAIMAADYFNEATATAKFADDSITGALIKDGEIATAHLAAGILAADVPGRAKMATGYFTEAKATDAFAAAAITGALLKADTLDLATVARVVDAKAIDTASIADSAIEALQLNADAVTTVKILDANVTAAKLAAVLCGAPTTRSGPGAVPITAPTCLVTSTGTGDALTIADGAHTGQRLTLVHVVDGGTAVITQTTGAKLTAAIATITLTAAYDTLTLEWSGALWNPVGWSGSTAIVNT